MKKVFTLITILILFSSCRYDSFSDLSDIDPNNPIENGETITYDEHIKPIYDQRCTSCHNPLNLEGGLDISTFSTARDNINGTIDRIDRQTGQPGVMPPAGRMPELDIDIIIKWLDDGLLEQ